MCPTLLDKAFVPAAQSTPKKLASRPTLQCPHCFKEYLVQFYFDRHVKTAHSTTGPTHVADSDISHGSLDVSDLSSNDTNLFKKPANPKKPKEVKKRVVGRVQKNKSFICTYCLNAYMNESGMRKHMRTHTMQTAASRYPNVEDIVAHAHEIGSKALTRVANCPSYGINGQLFRELVGHIVSISNLNDFSTMVITELVKAIDKKKTMLPSALVKCLLDRMEVMSCDDNFCDSCTKTLGIFNFPEDVQSQFLLEFLLCVTTELFHFISSSFRSHYTRAVRPMPELDMEDKQVIYYVAGSVMRGYFRMAYRYKASVKWSDICAVLKTHVLSSAPIGDIDAEWTRSLDRGGLLYINMDTQKFFIELTKLVYQNEKRDGSIDYDLVIKLVTESDTSVLWDNIFKDFLPEGSSISFMNDVVSSFCKACGRGIARRRLNALRDKPVISMPTRHAVASRKK